MKITVLGSCSSGNCTYVDTGSVKLLIDVGFSVKQIINKLDTLNLKITDIDAILITHEHTDHIKGLLRIIKLYNIRVYINKLTYEALLNKYNFKEEVKSKIIFIEDGTFLINDLIIEANSIYHDSAHCFCYILEEKGKKLGYITDTGCLTIEHEFLFRDCDILCLESNYDYEMLFSGKYPSFIKNRIHSNNGHLSNEQAVKFIRKIHTKKLKKVYLMHLSQNNNSVELVNKSLELIKDLLLDIEIATSTGTKEYILED